MMQPRLLQKGLIVVFLAAFTSTSWAGPREHGEGFMMRIALGGSQAKTTFEDPAGDFEISGPGGDVTFAIGAFVTPNLALHATLFGWLLQDPDADYMGSTGTVNGDVDMSAFGGGATWFFPGNFHVSGSAGVGSLTVDGPEGAGETDSGFAMTVSAGKEWWVSDRWGLGVEGNFGYHSLPEKGIDEKWKGTSFGLCFTATMD